MITVLRGKTWFWRVLSLCFILAALASAWLGGRGLTHSQVVITWSTASELDTAGFNLYRSQNLEGRFERVNPALIPSKADPMTGGDYEFEDTQVVAGQTYYYQLEAINMSGLPEPLGQLEIKAERGGWDKLLLAVLFLAFGLLVSPKQSRQSDPGKPPEVAAGEVEPRQD